MAASNSNNVWLTCDSVTVVVPMLFPTSHISEMEIDRAWFMYKAGPTTQVEYDTALPLANARHFSKNCTWHQLMNERLDAIDGDNDSNNDSGIDYDSVV
jgi:hypothetical protein